MKWKDTVFSLGVSLVLVLFLAGYSEAIKCVNPKGVFGCFSTIQEAVNAARPGETVQIFPGTYLETVVISADKRGLTLVGIAAGRVIHQRAVLKSPLGSDLGIRDISLGPQVVIDDPSLFTDSGDDTILIKAEDVTIKNITINNADNDGIHSDPNAEGTKVINVRILGADQDGIDLEGDNGFITKCLIRCAGRQEADQGDGIEVEGNTKVLFNTIQNASDQGIDIEGDNTVVEGNFISNVDRQGIASEGANVRIIKNTIENCREEGIRAIGDNPQIVSNHVNCTFDNGIIVECLNCCEGKIAFNEVKNAVNEQIADGIEIIAGSAGLKVIFNKAIRNGDDGFDLSFSDNSGILIQGNEALENGKEDGADGFEIDGQDHEIKENLAKGNFDDGFNITGENHFLFGNIALENCGDGIDVAPPAKDIKVKANLAFDNLRVGIKIGNVTEDNTVTLNTARGNRIDFCDGGNNTNIVPPNFFGTTSVFPCP
ncbi:MAG: right-handed parallel beta-helix repeat-containing protein [bacterium]